MKTMNYLLAIAFVFTVGSCSKEKPAENEDLAAVDFRGRMSHEIQEPQKILELDLHKFYVLNQLAKLDFEKRQLEELIDGGRKDLIPKLELTMKSFSEYETQLLDIQKAICSFLGFIADELAELASAGDSDAEKKLWEMDEKLKECGIEVSYAYFEISGVNYATLPKTNTVGGCKIPKRAFKACDVPLSLGGHIVLTNDRLDQIIIKSGKGQTIGKAELIGKSKVIDGYYEYALTIASSIGSQLSMEVSKKDEIYNVPIVVAEGI